jgi:toxin-antitoxin system PIN domain toxin
VILVDLNLLLYAVDRSSSRHDAARQWLQATLGGDEEVRFAMHTLLGFLRLSTSPSVFDRPLTAERAIAMIAGWVGRENVEIATPTERHWQVLGELAEAGRARGPLLMDAHLAALSLEYGATLATADRDFARFPGLRWKDPIAT